MEVPRVAKVQYGVFSAGQAEAAGWTARQVRRRITTRHWVYVSVPDAVISHHTAAGVHGLPIDLPCDQAHLISSTRSRPGGVCRCTGRR